jgi:hypothetical protein
LVREALSELGGDVTAPDRKGVEDGRIVDPTGRKMILEVKSRAGASKLDDVRQLQDWVTAALTDDSQDWDGSGLLVVCTFAETPIGERGEAFPHNTRERAKRFGQALLTTTQLFRALADAQDGRLSTDQFWQSIREADPLCDLPELEPASADSPSPGSAASAS